MTAESGSLSEHGKCLGLIVPRNVTARDAGAVGSARRSAMQVAATASKLALQGLLVASLMGILFGLLIGFGGAMLGVETQRLTVIGGLSGWISGLVAMLFVFAQMRRNHRANR